MATQDPNFPGTGYGNPYLDTLISGSRWVGGPIKYAFAEGPIRSEGTLDGYGESWTSFEKLNFRKALDAISSVCNVTFVETGLYTDANMLWYSVHSSVIGDSDSEGHHDFPDGTLPRTFGYFSYDQDYWMNQQFQPGQYGFWTIIHEIMHGLGLNHSFVDDDNGNLPGFPGADGQDQEAFSAMSYTSGWSGSSGPDVDDRGHVKGPMALDIAALQRIYGAKAKNADNTWYGLEFGNIEGTGYQCIWDTGGNADTIWAGNATVNVTIDLRAATLVGANAGGYMSFADGVAGGITIANGVVIENAIGGAGNDRLTGNHAHNEFIGGAGGDRFDGQGGYDTVVYETYMAAGQIIDMLRPSWGTGEAFNDSFISIEAIKGAESSDDIRGTAGIEALYGRGGADILRGRGGADILDGGEGNDTAAYETAVTVDLMFGYLNTGEAAGDTLISIERLSGSSGRDDLRGDMLDNTLTGNGDADVLRGRGGNDTLEGGSGADILWGDQGSDFLDGGTGADIMYGGTEDDTYLVDNVGDQVIEYAGEGTDTIAVIGSATATTRYTLAEGSNVERLEGDGSSYAFILTGNSLANEITGSFGADTLRGMGGNDKLNGWVGDDRLEGGDGDDVIMAGLRTGHDVYVGGDGIDTLSFYNDFSSGMTFDLAAGVQTFGRYIPGVGFRTYGSITWSEIENVEGAGGDDTIYGDAGNNRLMGSLGHDTLDGRYGDDVLDGGLGFETMDGGAGNDTFIGTYEYSVYGVDVMRGGEGSDTADFSNHGHAVWIDLMYAGREVWTTDRADVVTGTWRQVADLDSVENLVGTAGADQLFGSNDANRIDGGGGNDVIYGRDGADILNGGYRSRAEARSDGGNDIIYGEGGDDTIYVLWGNDTIDGGDGIDTMSFADALQALTIDLNARTATYWEGGGYEEEFEAGFWGGYYTVNWNGIENLTTGAGNDILISDWQDNVLDGGIGSDIASFHAARAEYEIVVLADGRVQVTDTRAERDGSDVVTNIEWLRFTDGDVEVALLLEGPTMGDDRLVGSSEDDHLRGLGGDDRLLGGRGDDTLEGNEGDDILNGQGGDDLMFGGTGADKLTGAAGNDEIWAEDGDDKLFGNGGYDSLHGGAGDDRIDAGAGDDWLDGDMGADVLTGGAGADVFYFVKPDEGTDRITDFVSGQDQIGLWAPEFGVTSIVQGDTFFYGNRAPAAADGPAFIYNSNNGALLFDEDGFGGAAATVLARLAGAPTLQASDFLLLS